MNRSPVKILVIEDEPQIRRCVCDALQESGYQTTGVSTAKEGIDLAATGESELIILDLGLPDMSGLAFIRELRAWSSLPVLILSARAAEEDKIEALDTGADDYLSKPFGIGELLARVRVLLRRGAQGNSPPVQHFGNIEIDLARHSVRRDSQLIHLTQTEFRLLAVLTGSSGKVLTNRHLMREVWGPGHLEQEHYVRIYMRRLRQKLEVDPTRPRYLLTETGVGYRFQPG